MLGKNKHTGLNKHTGEIVILIKIILQHHSRLIILKNKLSACMIILDLRLFLKILQKKFQTNFKCLHKFLLSILFAQN
jgi:hypothetical protein